MQGPRALFENWSVPASWSSPVRVSVKALPPVASLPALTQLVSSTELASGDWQQYELRAGDVLPASTRKPTGRIVIQYSLPVQQGAASPTINTQFFLAAGADILLLPKFSKALTTEVVFDSSQYSVDLGVGAASSFGLENGQRLPITWHGLRAAIFSAGWRGWGQFKGPEGEDNSTWYGYSRFDPRALLAEVAGFRTAVRFYFGQSPRRPLLLLLASRNEAMSGFEVARATAAVVAQYDTRQELTSAFRLSIFHQVLKEWLGAQVSVVDAQGSSSIEFTEGFSRYLARQFAFEFGLLSPEEYLEELNGLLAVEAITGQASYGPHCSSLLPASDIKRQQRCARLRRLTRGALHGTWLDSALQAHETTLAELLATVMSSEAQPMTQGTWSEAVSNAGGPAALAALKDLKKNRSLRPRSRALGRCFVPKTIVIGETQLGFDYRGAPGNWVVSKVARKSPAYAAGIREGQSLSAIAHSAFDSEQDIVVRPSEGKLVVYRGKTRRWKIPGFGRARNVPDAACRPL